MTPRRREGAVLKSAAAALSVAVLATACGGSDSGDDGTVVVASWGAYFTEATRMYLADTYTEDTRLDGQIVDALGEFATNREAKRQADNVQWDLLDSNSAPDAYQMAADGLIQTLTEDLRTEWARILGEENV